MPRLACHLCFYKTYGRMPTSDHHCYARPTCRDPTEL